MPRTAAGGGNINGLLVAVALLCPAAMAAGQTATIAVTATVPQACTTSAEDSDGVLDFGTLDFGTYASLDADLTAVSGEGTGSIGVTCVSGQTYTILLDGGQSGDTSDRRMLGASLGAEVTYNLYTSSAHDTVWDDVQGISATASGQTQWHAVYALVPAQTTPAADQYSDTIAVTVSW